ncbi:UbiX family flavin prenyltransferase [Natrarchaeobius oligotrophus]|uniref:Flavin prenyltransferase UbiX n=1 Tax=Natrarchaeobius chitinivorans TaxID=1679083 RepID=A0A3N6PLI5_NATCH|nr:UbiX family flavin prenyltransferase [Natrarchaeobius chitinivorans]RQH02310.1 UbiX family flavin prenyltransferase [Natrarchaeobius chitinivorans]
MPQRIVIGMTGATGQIYGIRALQLLRETEYEVHLILSDAGKINVSQEADYEVSEVSELADVVHDVKNIGAETASGSFRTEGMLIAPCSMKTLSNIAHGSSGDLITRSADVALKERRPLVLMPREKPFNRIHLKNMLEVTDAGAIVFPPFPSFYQGPTDLDDMITRTTARALSQLSVDVEVDEWEGLSSSHSP